MVWKPFVRERRLAIRWQLKLAGLVVTTVTFAPLPAAGGASSFCGPSLQQLREQKTASSRTLAQGLFVLHVYGSGAANVTDEQRRANMDLYGVGTPAEVIRRWTPAGIILLPRNTRDPNHSTVESGNITTTKQLTKFTTDLRTIDPKLLISIDQEGGRVNRLRPLFGPTPSAAVVSGSQEATNAAAQKTGVILHRVGINMDFAPVADVVTNDTNKNSIIGDRSYGSNPQIVSARISGAIEELQKQSVAAVAKHWPGHGSTTTDSHIKTPSLDFSDTAVATANQVPFDAASAHGVAAIMVGHLGVPAWDRSGTPATISQPILGRLRSSYCGTIVSDSLWMGGIRAFGPDRTIPLRALNAGMDLFLMPVDLGGAVEELAQAADTNRQVRSELISAGQRVADLRARYQIH